MSNGEKFLKLVDEQNNIQWKIVENLTKLINSNWDLPETKSKLATLVQRHKQITVEINGLHLS